MAAKLRELPQNDEFRIAMTEQVGDEYDGTYYY